MRKGVLMLVECGAGRWEGDGDLSWQEWALVGGLVVAMGMDFELCHVSRRCTCGEGTLSSLIGGERSSGEGEEGEEGVGVVSFSLPPWS